MLFLLTPHQRFVQIAVEPWVKEMIKCTHLDSIIQTRKLPASVSFLLIDNEAQSKMGVERDKRKRAASTLASQSYLPSNPKKAKCKNHRFPAFNVFVCPEIMTFYRCEWLKSTHATTVSSTKIVRIFPKEPDLFQLGFTQGSIHSFRWNCHEISETVINLAK